MAETSHIDVLRAIQLAATSLQSELVKRPCPLTNEQVRGAIRELVDRYFRAERPILWGALGRELLFGGLDTPMQNLLELAQRASSNLKFRSQLERVRQGAAEKEIQAIEILTIDPDAIEDLNSTETRLLQTLEAVHAESAICYRQTLLDLRDERRVSWRGTATELREALRELLDHLAPQSQVEKMPGYRQDPDRAGPTMKQKTAFILKSRKTTTAAKKSVEDAVAVVEEKVGAFVRTAYNQSSASVHTAEGRAEVLSIKRFTEVALAELLELGDA